MTSRFFHSTLAILLTLVLITPAAFFVAPSRAHALLGVLDQVTEVGAQLYTEYKTTFESTISAIHNTITSVATVTSAAALQALVINTYILEPLAFVLSGDLLKVITQGTIAFVIGKANGTGLPQFVADIQRSMQTVTDVHTLAFLNEYMRSSKSPYHGSIIDALRRDYLNRASLEGFWAANMDTLRKTSPNPLGYINGNWMLGGTAAWFALTTQSQNNPYSLYQDSQKQLANMNGPGVGGSTGARIADVISSNGFTGWCGNTDDVFGLGELPADPTAQANSAAVDQAANDAYDAAYNAAIAVGGNPSDIAYDNAYNAAIANGRSTSDATAAAIAAKSAAGGVSTEAYAKAAGKAAYDAAFAKAKATTAGHSYLGIAPGDLCTNADGTTGTIKTPGSVIVAGLNKVLGGQQDSVVRMGNVGPQINQILGNIATVLKTVDFAAKILGGPGSGGLFGVNQPNGANQISPLRQYTGSSGNLGVTNVDVAKNAATLPLSGADMLSRVSQYESVVNIIGAAANTASTSVASLISYCAAQQQVATDTLSSTGNSIDLTNLSSFASTSATQIIAAQNAITIEIVPIFAIVNTASTTISAARALVQKIQMEMNSNDTVVAYTADLQMLQTMSPTLADVANMQRNTIQSIQTTATASPPGSLNVSGNVLVDRMSLISTNATALRSSCTAPAPTPTFASTPTP
ncbi:MAG: hypothetical protein NT108_01320 [Candidatus Kaiserbacteria bacterium]|nr:hypothetical protein [Candidatus Kaiserbacteria bacterium]